MNSTKGNRLKTVFRAELLCPAGFVAIAALITLGYSVASICGWRQYTTFLCGTSAVAGMSYAASAARGIAYVLLYHGFVLLAPVLLLGAGFLAVIEHFLTPRRPSSQPEV